MGFGIQSGISQGTWTDFEVRQVAIADITCPEGGRSVGSIEQLAESIRDVGLLNPITVTADLRLIAGQHRLAAFKLLGKDQIPARIVSATEIRTHLARLDENLLRSELTALERAEHLYQRKRVFESLYPDTKRGGNRGNQYTGGKPRQMARSAFCHTAAARFGRSDRSIRQYVQIAQKLSDEARERIRGTPIEDNADTLVRLSRLPREDQRAVVEIMLERGLRSVREASLQATRAKRQAMAGMDVSLSLHLTDNASLRHGDFRELSTALPDNSVDLILTDPPYHEKYLGLAQDLGAIAHRVLKPGASMFCMVGAYHLPRILADLSERLEYRWQFAFVMAGNGAVVHSRRVISAYRPVLWFTKGPYIGPVFNDVIFGNGKDKRFHPWGQSEIGFDTLVQRYSQPGDLVLDPFLGGGTTGAVAVRNGRRFIGFDIDEQSVAMTTSRLLNNGGTVEHGICPSGSE